MTWQYPLARSQPITAATDIPDCALWLDASQIVGFADGDPLTLWPDESGSGFDANGTDGVNEVQGLDISGATMGQYELSSGADITGPIQWNANAAALQTALETLSDVGPGNVTVTAPSFNQSGSPDPQTYRITFVGALAGTAVAALTPTQDTLDVLPVITGEQVGAAANPPIYKTAIQNGKAVVRFNGSIVAQYLNLTAAGLSLLEGIDAVTVAIAAAATANETAFCCAGGFNNSNERLQVDLSDLVHQFATCNDDTSDQQDIATTIPVATAFAPRVFLGYSALTLGMIGCELTDVAVPGASSFGDTPGPFPSTPSINITVGCGADAPGGSTGLSGDIFELAVYTRALEAAERREVMEYLSAKWATL